MVPRKATAANKAGSKDKVVKRPARGYHKFKNGLFNVTPKRSEKELVKVNQQSPLLRLPPEIRNRIWEFALGGMVYRVKNPDSDRHRKLAPSPKQPAASPSFENGVHFFIETAHSLFGLLPGLKQIVVRIFQCKYVKKAYEDDLRAVLEEAASGPVNVKIEHTNRHWLDYDTSFWKGSAQDTN
ncbi:hypothetical protein PtrSN002B_008404 [Pyrenophora tritici-repentis]|uniref:Uncharacterized protein n=1 Tax=Pyrenophora tritici-repentis TaxID=45151 RepID=A0A2W1FJB1_9PLEO|nr:hypothetical protein PtrV1_10445 [Pyrenophora tritici-repentis]KAG9382125.1 hypothetical protein A1F94_007779 [Pyrenophora tritici-repentis]KAI0580128.1 hypothetical protein Alg130_07193 [Pyrenophora tritici-repentis]KAI0620832.1 hypothetical protein TUN199_07193 [Pyrenophora tritici-repentis]KAI1515257.1 hypothetical protein Ptr86124_005258 [Pyrenophora tritici-repentis]